MIEVNPQDNETFAAMNRRADVVSLRHLTRSGFSVLYLEENAREGYDAAPTVRRKARAAKR